MWKTTTFNFKIETQNMDPQKRQAKDVLLFKEHSGITIIRRL
jgi:hypothetical protein